MAFDISGSPSSAVRSEINVTPLVDVVLVLLIIFMVVTPLLQMSYDVNVPPKAEASNAPPPTDLVVVSLTADKGIFINKESVPLEQLRFRLAEILKNRSRGTVFFSADDRVKYADAVKVLDVMRASGAKNLGIVEEFVDPTSH